MLILEYSQGCDGRTEGSVTISLCNFVGEGIKRRGNGLGMVFSLLQVKGEIIHKVGRFILSNHAFFILYYLVGSDKNLDFFLQKLSSESFNISTSFLSLGRTCLFYQPAQAN
jgi:hypothetical protein